MSKRLIIILSSIFFLVSLVVLMPASVVWQLLKNEMPGIQLSHVEGSIWSGRAATISGMGETFQNLTWELYPAHLFMAEVKLDLQVKDKTHPLKALVVMDFNSNVQISNMKGRLPARILQQIPATRIVNLEGLFNFEMRQVIINKQGVKQADGIVLLEKANLIQPVQGFLGNLRFIIASKKDQIHIKIDDMNAPIKVKGNLNILNNHRFNFDARLTPTPAADNFLVSLLRNSARRNNDGSYVIQYNGAY